MNSCKRPRFYTMALAALLLAGILLWCHVNQAAKPEPTAAAGPCSVVVCGTPFGVKMFSDGALVVAFADRYSASGRENPAKEAGLRLGDLIISAAGRPVHSNDDLSAALQTGQGSAVPILYRRGGHEYTAQLTPWADASGVYKAGLWVRDSSAGIGTLTFVDPVAGSFAGLGHPISDVDTGADFTRLSGAKRPPGQPGSCAENFCLTLSAPSPETTPPACTAATPPPRKTPERCCPLPALKKSTPATLSSGRPSPAARCGTTQCALNGWAADRIAT